MGQYAYILLYQPEDLEAMTLVASLAPRFGFYIILQSKKPGLLGEMAGSRTGAENIHNEPVESYCARK